MTNPEGENQKTARRGGKAVERETLRRRLTRLILQEFERKLMEDRLNVTVGDVLKVLQLEEQDGEEDVQEVRVRWVEPEEAESASGE